MSGMTPSEREQEYQRNQARIDELAGKVNHQLESERELLSAKSKLAVQQVLLAKAWGTHGNASFWPLPKYLQSRRALRDAWRSFEAAAKDVERLGEKDWARKRVAEVRRLLKK